MFVASLIDQPASASFLETMRSSAYYTIQTNKGLFDSYVSKAPVRMIDEMVRRNLLGYRAAVELEAACRYHGDVSVQLIDTVIGRGNETCRMFIKYLCQVGITKHPALSELHQLGRHDVPADSDFQRAVCRHKRDLQAYDYIYHIEALVHDKVLCQYNKEVLELAAVGIDVRGAREAVDKIMFSGEQHCKSFLEMVKNPEFLRRFPADHKLLDVLQAYRPED